MVKKLLTNAAISLLSLTFCTVPVLAEGMTIASEAKDKNFNLTKQCLTAITNAKNKLEKIPQIQVVKSPIFAISYPNHHQGRLHKQEFHIRGASVNSVMNSPTLLNTIATPIIKTCDSISLVVFEVHQTDWSRNFALMPNGKVELTECPVDFQVYPYKRRFRSGQSCYRLEPS